jgi:hypothetical protein
VVAGVLVGMLSLAGARAGEPDPRTAFFDAVERGDAKAAREALPPAVRDLALYDAKTEATPIPIRDQGIYADIVAKVEAKHAASEADRKDAAVQLELGVLALRDRDLEGARRKLLLAAKRHPRYRVAHLHLARTLAVLEADALKEAGDRSAGEVLIERVGAGASDVHVDMAQLIVDQAAEAAPDGLPSVRVSFTFDAGKVGKVEVERGTVPAARAQQREASSAPQPGHWLVLLVGQERLRVDEAWFAPVRTMYMDGGEPGRETHERRDETTFPVSVDLLALDPTARVLVIDPQGRRVVEAPVPAPR